MQEHECFIRNATLEQLIGADYTLERTEYALSMQTETFSAHFQTKPEIGIVVSGKKPEFSEFVNAFANTSGCYMPINAIQVFYIAVCVAFDAKDS